MRRCQVAIETNSQKPQWIEITITDIKKRSLRGLMDSLVAERCRDCSKQFFQRRENIDMNAIKHATQPKIQTTF